MSGTYDEVMSESCLTIGEARPFVKFSKQYLGGNEVFISLMHNQIVELFDVFGYILKFYLEP